MLSNCGFGFPIETLPVQDLGEVGEFLLGLDADVGVKQLLCLIAVKEPQFLPLISRHRGFISEVYPSIWNLTLKVEDISLLWFERGRFCAEFTTAGTIRNLLENSVFTTLEFAKAHAFYGKNILVNDYISATKMCKPISEFVAVSEETHEDY